MQGSSYKWTVALVVIFGIFMSVLDTTIVNNIISRLQSSFGASLTDVDWVSTGYTLAEGVAAPLAPFFTARLGIKRFYLTIVALFALGSFLCGIAWSLQALIVFRIIQGVAGSCMLPVGITLLYSVFPPDERGRAMSVMGVPILLAPALGPTVGGYIVTYYHWSLVFFINVPIGIAGLILGTILLREAKAERNIYFDIPGFLFSATGLASLLYAASDAGSNGWGSSRVQTFLVIGVCCLIVFVIAELLTIELGRQPLLDVRLFANRTFAGGTTATVLSTVALYGGLYLVPIYLQGLRGLTAYESGLELLPQAFASMVAVAIGGVLSDKIGIKRVAIPGLLILGFSLWRLSTVTLQTPYSNYQLLLLVRGFGLGLCVQTITQGALRDLKPKQLSQGSTLNSMVRSISSSLGIAVITTMVTTQKLVHTIRLSEQIAPGTPYAGLVQQLTGYFMGKGYNQSNALAAALKEINGLLQQRAYMLAINDAFLFTLGITFVSILAVAVLMTSRPTAPTQVNRKLTGESTTGAETVEEEEEEAMVFVH